MNSSSDRALRYCSADRPRLQLFLKRDAAKRGAHEAKARLVFLRRAEVYNPERQIKSSKSDTHGRNNIMFKDHLLLAAFSLVIT